MKIRKTKHLVTGTYLYITPKWAIMTPQNLRLSLRPVSSHFIFLSSAGIKGMHHHCLPDLCG